MILSDFGLWFLAENGWVPRHQSGVESVHKLQTARGFGKASPEAWCWFGLFNQKLDLMSLGWFICWITQSYPCFNHLAVDVRWRWSFWRQSSFIPPTLWNAVPQHNCTTPMIDSWHNVLRLKPNVDLSKHPVCLLSHMTTKLLSRRHMACPWGVSVRAGASSISSWWCETSLQHFPLHDLSLAGSYVVSENPHFILPEVCRWVLVNPVCAVKHILFMLGKKHTQKTNLPSAVNHDKPSASLMRRLGWAYV